MTTKTERRLEALEAHAAHIDTEPLVIIITLVSPGHLDDEPTCARIGDEVLRRTPGETVADFRGRAKAEALRQRGGSGSVPLVLLNPFDESEPVGRC